ncbi:hypothetical protein ATANTOWER_012626 [Ataeniobius toweri]|uniref:Transmembrane protein n=1 Tax=Ataeniobius toweri TaxID=208326 RepID=A0ABU7APW0_9TELE|nr:hypothetical protein [Ataeniobius toweri]
MDAVRRLSLGSVGASRVCALYWSEIGLAAGWFLVGSVCFRDFYRVSMDVWKDVWCLCCCSIGLGKLLLGFIFIAWLAWMLVFSCLGVGAAYLRCGLWFFALRFAGPASFPWGMVVNGVPCCRICSAVCL